MSIFRHINGKNNDRDFLEKKREYITDDVKTNGGTLVGTYGCLSEHGTDDWVSVKKAYHKSGGKQGEHTVFSLTPDRKSVSNEVYMQIAREVAERLYHDFNCIYAVHIDSQYRHIHFLVNTVSFVDGRRFHSTKSDLASAKAAINQICEKFGFDIITSSTDTMVDDTPYDFNNGFDDLEITDDKPYEEPCIDINADDDKEEFPDSDATHSVVVPKREVLPFCSDYSSPNNYNPYENPVETDYVNFNNMNKGENVTMYSLNSLHSSEVNSSESKPSVQSLAPVHTTPSVLTSQSAQDSPNPIQTMTLNLSPKITLNATIDTSPDTIKEYINAVTPKTDTTAGLDAAVTMAHRLDLRCIHMNIEANLFPDITINLVEPSSADDNVIEVETNKPW